jgi:hypothetical protein
MRMCIGNLIVITSNNLYRLHVGYNVRCMQIETRDLAFFAWKMCHMKLRKTLPCHLETDGSVHVAPSSDYMNMDGCAP